MTIVDAALMAATFLILAALCGALAEWIKKGTVRYILTPMRAWERVPIWGHAIFCAFALFDIMTLVMIPYWCCAPLGVLKLALFTSIGLSGLWAWNRTQLEKQQCTTQPRNT